MRHRYNMCVFGVCSHLSGLVFMHGPHCFSLMRRTGASHRMSCPLQFPSPMKRKGAARRLSAWKSPLQLQTPPKEGEWCWGVHRSGPVCITVTVGNRIHQIKSSIYLSGSGDSGGERGGGRWEGWPRGERVTLTRQSCGRGEGVGPGQQCLMASVPETLKELWEFSLFWSHLSFRKLISDVSAESTEHPAVKTAHLQTHGADYLPFFYFSVHVHHS